MSVFIEKALQTLINADAGVTALIAGRIYPLQTPEATPPLTNTEGLYPAIEYFKVTGPRDMQYGAPVGTARPRIQFNCYGNNYADCKHVFAALRSAINGYSGVVTTEDGPVTIQLIELLDERDGYNEQAKVDHVQSDFRVYHLE